MATALVDKDPVPQPSSAPDPAQLLTQIATGYMVSAALYPVTKLGIADLLAQGPRSVADLAQTTSADEDALYRVLRALASVGIFTESKPRTFSLTPMSDLLRSDVPNSFRELALWMTNEFHFKVWGQLVHSVMTGQPSVEKVYGKPAFQLFPELPEVDDEFNNAMTNISAKTIPGILAAYDFSGIETLVDIAGGYGYLLANILRQYPSLKGILFDQEHVIAGARQHVATNGLESRLQTISGDFFEAVPKGGDAYMMQHIIHDWDDAKCGLILGNVRRVLQGKPNGKLLILDSIINADGSADFAKWMDLEMLTMPGGKERTLEEFRLLLQKSGFQITSVHPTPSWVNVIEAQLS
jgi:hypothetical protein